jgi:hypothetical protein
MGAEDKVGAMQINARLCGVSLPVTRRLMITEQAFGRFRYPSARKPYFYINLALGPVMREYPDPGGVLCGSDPLMPYIPRNRSIITREFRSGYQARKARSGTPSSSRV